jgi:hypothetical protein
MQEANHFLRHAQESSKLAFERRFMRSGRAGQQYAAADEQRLFVSQRGLRIDSHCILRGDRRGQKGCQKQHQWN